MPRKSPLIIGHRGAPGYRPEHSRSSFELAFAMGVDAVEPDVVASKDGVLVIRHENEISGTTDVADRPEFADRRTTKKIDGQSLTGWFTEDFTWDELATLRTRERLPGIRLSSASFNDRQPILRLSDLLEMIEQASVEHGREIGLVLEIKHATYFQQIGLDLAPLIERDLRAAGWAEGQFPLIIEAFESTILRTLKDAGIRASFIYLIEAAGKPFDLLTSQGRSAPDYASEVTAAGLDRLRGVVDGVSVDKRMLLAPGNTIVADAHARGMRVFTWTARPENRFLSAPYRSSGGKSAFGDYEAEWRAIADTGVDGIFVDHPDLAVALFH